MVDTRNDDVSASKYQLFGTPEMSIDEDLELETKRQEKRVKRKIDFIILPLLASVYFIAQLGRSDLNNAKIAGLDTELGLTHENYVNIASVFYAGYLAFQLPGTLLLRKIGPPLQFAAAMLGWGILTASTVTARSYTALLVFRIFIGTAEAFIQGTIFYLSFWYRYDELATRGAIIYSTAALAGSFNGLLGYAIQTSLDGVHGFKAWQWIFLIEGIIPIVWAFVIFFALPPTPETIRWGFTPAEKKIVVRRSRAAHNSGESKIYPKLILKLLADPKFWIVTIIDSGAHFCVSSLSNFLGDILKGLTGGESEDSVNSQLLTVIVYAGAFVGIITASRVSDKIGQRAYVICAVSAIAVVGYALLLGVTNATGRIVATTLVAVGAYPIVVLSLAWVASNFVGYTYRGSAAALINVVAQTISIAGNQAYNDPPYFRTGIGSSLALIALSGIAAFCLRLVLVRENAKKLRNQNTPEAEALRGKSFDEIGNNHPDFFFSY